jgi:GalNAc-alpha-(1->4)-GalNAc-alpha-(1->3)-diNAcBac-PP-undecaprenol alpha-1,4-N-acetyl-D-galactosaminyltransferase
MTAKNKVLIVGPCLSMGGIERASVNTANELDALQCKVIYVAIFKRIPFFKLNSDVVFEEPTDGSNVQTLAIFKTILRLRRTIKHHQPDTVLAFNKFYAALTAFSLIGLSVPLFISERSSPFYKWPKKIDGINRLAFLLKKPKGVIAQTKIAASFQAEKYRGSVVQRIPNIVRHVRLFENIEREPFILAIGRLNDPLKGFDRLLEALSKTTTDWPLYFAGGEADTDESIKALLVSKGLDKRVHFLGKVLAMDELLARAGMFVIPSRSEGFPNALVEAMAAGIPCISYDFVAGPQDIIENNTNAVLVPEGDIHGLEKAIDSLVLDPEKRAFLGKNAIKVREEYRAGKIAQEIKNFILQ